MPNMPRRQVLIAGAGAFGLSTALHLLQTGSYDVTIVERSATGLAPDAASTDINKVVRSDYSDEFYARFTREAIAEFKKVEDWGTTYHESGVVMVGGQASYSSASLEISKRLGCRIVPAPDRESLLSCFPPGVQVGDIGTAYLNRDGGWVEARAAMELLLARVRNLGGKLRLGSSIVGLAKDENGSVDGLVLVSGEVLRADLVVVACGSWTPALLAEYGVADRAIATGQSVLFVELSEEEMEVYGALPVVVNFATGLSIFPPNQDRILKMSMHNTGYVNPLSITTPTGPVLVSTPITAEDGDFTRKAIPLEMLHQLRAQFRILYPSLCDKPFIRSRLCWYTDTPDSDWLVDFHPDHPKLLIATGGSGHAFKFLPLLGALTKQRIEGNMSAELAERFSISKRPNDRDMTRDGQAPKVLRLDELAGPQYFLSVNRP